MAYLQFILGVYHMEQLSELDIAMNECTVLSQQLNQEIAIYNDLQTKIMERSSKLFVPFGLENADSDPAMEELIQGTKNVLSKIKNFIIKLWTAIKELADKALHVFDGTSKKLKQFQAALKTGKQPNQNNFTKRIVMYPNAIMIKRTDAILNEINMRWTETNGSPNTAERKSLDSIGFHIRNNKGKVTASYNGAFPREDTVIGHGYNLADIALLVDNAIALFEQFPKYKTEMVNQFDKNIKDRYSTANSDTQKAQVILMDRVSYMSMHKTMQYILKSIREIGNQSIALCKTVGI